MENYFDISKQKQNQTEQKSKVKELLLLLIIMISKSQWSSLMSITHIESEMGP